MDKKIFCANKKIFSTNKQMKLIKTSLKSGVIALVTVAIVAGALFYNVKTSSATGAGASFFISHLGFNMNENSGWKHAISASGGQYVALYVEVQTQPGTHHVSGMNVKVDIPSSSKSSASSSATASANGISSRTDDVAIHFRGANCKLVYEPGSTSMRLDRNRDGVAEIDGPFADTITTSGIDIGDFGTNGQGGVVQISFKTRVECKQPHPSPSPSPSPSPVVSPSPSPSPSPTPSPAVSPSPSPSPSPAVGASCPVNTVLQQVGNSLVCVSNTNTNTNNNSSNNSNSVTQNNNQTVTVNNPAPAVLAASAPLKQPETGVSVLGLMTMFSAAPFGLLLSRYGRGRLISGKKEENMADVAKGLVEKRQGKRV